MAAVAPKRPKALKRVDVNVYLAAMPKAKSTKAKKVLAALAKLPEMTDQKLAKFNERTKAFSGRIFRG